MQARTGRQACSCHMLGFAGGCKIPLQQVVKAGYEEVKAAVVTRKGKHHGFVFLKLAFKPLSKQMVRRAEDPMCAAHPPYTLN